MNKQIFISYSSYNLEEVQKIVRAIESYEIGCWFQFDDSKAEYISEIEKGISGSKAFVVFISHYSISSYMVNNEIMRAIGKLKVDSNYKIIPVIIEHLTEEDNNKLTLLLGSINWVLSSDYQTEYEIARKILKEADIEIITEKKNKYDSSDEIEKVRLSKQAKLLAYHVSETIDEEYKIIGNILDIGCADGTGIMLKLKNRQYRNFCGVDINADEIKQAQKKYDDKKHTFICCDVLYDSFEVYMSEYLKQKNIKGFDLVVISYVLLHLKEPLKLLRNVRKYINKGGKIIIQDIDDGISLVYPSEDYFEKAFILWKNAYDSGDRNMARKIPLLLQKAGFKNVKITESSLDSLNYEYKEILWDFFFNTNYWGIKGPTDFHDSSVFKYYEECFEKHENVKKRFMNDEIFISLGMFVIVGENI